MKEVYIFESFVQAKIKQNVLHVSSFMHLEQFIKPLHTLTPPPLPPCLKSWVWGPVRKKGFFEYGTQPLEKRMIK